MIRSDWWGLGSAAAAAGLWAAGAPGELALGLAGGAYTLGMVDGVARPASSLLFPVLSHGPRGRAEVALTFDDGPDPEITPRVLDALAARGAVATFFVIGRHAEAHPALVARMLEEGHGVANHSYAHPRLLNLRRGRAMAAEIEAGERVLRALGGPVRPLYRPPIGLKNPPLGRIARARGLQVVLWSLHGRDTRVTPPEAIAARVLGRVRGGDIVLLHDGHDRGGPPRAATPAAVAAILEGLAARGLATVRVDRWAAT